jgi:hypothetical protein
MMAVRDAHGEKVPQKRGSKSRFLGALTSAVLAMAAGVISVGSLTTSAGAIGNGTFSVAPVSSSQFGRTVFTPVLSPGVAASDEIVVINETAAPLTLRLYTADGFTTTRGSFGLNPPYKRRRKMGSWIHLPVTQVTIAPRSGDIVPFQYDPPANVAPGDYAGGIVAEQTTSKYTKQGTVHVRVIQAIGVAVYGRIRGKLLPRLEVTGVSVSTKQSLGSQFGGSVSSTVTYTVTNTGNENLKPTVAIGLNPLVGSGPTYRTKMPQILAGSTVTLSHTFKSVSPYGELTAMVNVFKGHTTAAGSGGTLIVPWGIVAIVVVILLLVGFSWWRRNRKRSRNMVDDPMRAYPVAVGRPMPQGPMP